MDFLTLVSERPFCPRFLSDHSDLEFLSDHSDLEFLGDHSDDRFSARHLERGVPGDLARYSKVSLISHIYP